MAFKQNITEYPRIGDIITIISRNGSTMWTSGAGGKQPDNSIKYPFTGEIQHINYSSHPAIKLDGWGFDLDYVDWKIGKQEVVYEIY